MNALGLVLLVAIGTMFTAVVVAIIEALKVKNVTHYMRTDMVSMVLTVDEYKKLLASGDINNVDAWKPVFNGRMLPLDKGVMEDYLAMCTAYAEEAEAHYAAEEKAAASAASTDVIEVNYTGEAPTMNDTVVNVVGYCLCKTEDGTNKPYHFTTMSIWAKDDKFLGMIACNHCSVCNPEIEEMLSTEFAVDTIEKLGTSDDAYIVRFNDGTYTEACYSEKHALFEPRFVGKEYCSEITNKQAAAIEKYTGCMCVQF